MEIASMGALSKLHKILKHQLPEKATLANEMELNVPSEFANWLKAITYVRNIIAYHSRMWSRNRVKLPIAYLNNPRSVWLDKRLSPVQKKEAIFNHEYNGLFL
jgi:abortive infection bacteriophage resistance protein